MKWIAALALLLWSTAALAAPRPVDRRYYEETPGGASSSQVQHAYPGTANTLPYGHTSGWDAGLITHATAMPAVQRAMARMAQRGYVRRADLDAGFTVDGYANVMLAYEKPGVPLSERSPVVSVITQPFYVSSTLRWIPASQVACGAFRDSSGTIVPTCSPEDSAVVLTASGGTDALGAGTLEAAIAAAHPEWWSDEDINYRYTAHEQFFPQDWHETTSPGMQVIWNSWGTEMREQMSLAALRSTSMWFTMPPMGAGVGQAASVIGAGVAANYHFWMHPPDTSGVGH